ncbi:MAG: glycoside hydrolase family 31 [Anaerolineae bacterium]|nr:glycoside hydrolase family 31 [Anaerolineae bacterium]
MQVIHAPFGQEHPYEQLPEERFPRQPLAGAPFTVGIVTRPPGAVESIRVHAQVGGRPLQTIAAEHIADWHPAWEEGVGAEYLERKVTIDQDVWQAQLTAPPVGETLTYWIEADGEQTERFNLRGEGWRSGGGWSFDAGTMRVNRTWARGPRIFGVPEVEDIAWLEDGQRARRVRVTFRCRPDERFFGLGERFNALDQRGNVLDVLCYEQYKNQGKRTYMPIPFLLSSAGYGLFVQSSRWMRFDLAASDAETWTLEADLGADESLNLTWICGSDPFEITGRFARMTGPAKLPPLWTFGLWMSGNEWNSQARVLHEAQQSLDHAIQPSVLVIEAWSDETTFYIWNDAEYDARPGAEAFRYDDFRFPAEGKWPNPKAMVDWLHEHDIRLLLWQIPVLKRIEGPHAQHEADHAHFERAGFGVREADGSPHKLRPFWFRGGYIWDVTNPAERDWWLNKRAYLLNDLGIDGFKTDGGEHIWGTDTRFADGRRGAELINEYPQRYTQAYYDFATARRDAITFSRAGYTGSQRAPLHWAGDENSTWDAYRHSILAGLSAGISGVPFWGWDIGGFSGEIPSAELYLRAAAMAAFCPVMQYHSEFNQHREPLHDRTPWNIQARSGDARVISTFRHFVNVRHNLMPYIWQEARHAAESGEPMMRALALTHPEASPYAYGFGRDLLVYPVVEEGVARWPVALPEGTWHSLWDGAAYDGGQTFEIDAPLDRIPVFVRDGASIPVRYGDGGQLGDPVPLSAEANGVWRAG